MALPSSGSGASWTLTPSGSPEGCRSRPPLAKLPTSSFFLVFTLTTGCRGSEMDLGLLVEVAELGITVGVVGALQGLDRALKPIAVLLEQPPHRVVADRMPLGGERGHQEEGA